VIEDPTKYLKIQISKASLPRDKTPFVIDSKNLIAIVRISIEELIEYNAQIDQWFPVERTKLYAPPRKDDVSQIRLDLTAEKEPITKESNEKVDENSEIYKKDKD